MITIIIIVVTAAVSVICFSQAGLFETLKFSAYDVWHRRQWHQLLTYGLVHGGWGHLLFNMITLYCFGRIVEQYFGAAFGDKGPVLYVVFYVTALIVSTIGDLIKFRDNPSYSAVGASGAVSAILFAAILFEPRMGIYCIIMARKNVDNIGHSAHFWGAVYGLLFPLLLRPDIFTHFLNQLHG